MMLHAAGVAASAARRYELVVRLLVEPKSEDSTGHPGRLAEVLSVSDVIQDGDKRLYAFLEPLIRGQLGRGAAYPDDWDRWQLLVSVAMTDARGQGRAIGGGCSYPTSASGDC